MKDIKTTTEQIEMFLHQLIASEGHMVNGTMLATRAGKVLDDVRGLSEQNEALNEALLALYTDTKSYIKNNNLGAVHHSQSMKLAGKALGFL